MPEFLRALGMGATDTNRERPTMCLQVFKKAAGKNAISKEYRELRNQFFHVLPDRMGVIRFNDHLAFYRIIINMEFPVGNIQRIIGIGWKQLILFREAVRDPDGLLFIFYGDLL